MHNDTYLAISVLHNIIYNQNNQIQDNVCVIVCNWFYI